VGVFNMSRPLPVQTARPLSRTHRTAVQSGAQENLKSVENLNFARFRVCNTGFTNPYSWNRLAAIEAAAKRADARARRGASKKSPGHHKEALS